MNKRQRKKLFKGNILQYLHKYIDLIQDDAEWDMAEHDIIIDWCRLKKWKFTANDLDAMNIRGIDLDDLAHYYKER